MGDLISIIIPIYNTGRYLEKCIKSIINQTYQNIEVILVNDGSTDNSLKICRKFCGLDKRIKLLNQENRGLSAARNSGISVAKGQFLMFVDGDDFVKKNFCYSSIINQKKYKSDIVIFNYINIFNDHRETYSQNVQNGIISKEMAMSLIINDSHAWNKLYKSNLFNSIRYPIGKNYEDIFTTYKLFDKASKISYTNNAMYCYVHRDNIGISVSRSPKNVEDLFSANLDRYKFYKLNYPKVCKAAEKNLLESAFLLLLFKGQNSDKGLISIAKSLLREKEMIKKLDTRHKIYVILYTLFPKIITKIAKRIN